VSAAFDERDVTSILSGVFDIRSYLAHIAEDLHIIRELIEGDDDGEETEDEEPGPSS
jgi:hypothetical protein